VIIREDENMTVPIALQLYTVREALQKDYEGVVRKVAAMGYIGVETAGFPGTTPQAAGRLFKELGLVVPSIHKFPVPRPEHKAEILDILGALDSKVVVSGGGKDDFSSVESIRRISDQLNEANALFASHGIRVGVHNHWWEYLKVGERYAVDILLDTLTPEVFFQIDT
jgi:sugar phosphate isomerase/epimerase